MIALAGKLAVMAIGAIAMALPQTGRAADDADQMLAASCTGCHVSAAATGGIPSLVAQSPLQLEAQLLAYKHGTRQGTLMNRIARGYSDDELRRIAGVLGTAPVL